MNVEHLYQLPVILGKLIPVAMVTFGKSQNGILVGFKQGVFSVFLPEDGFFRSGGNAHSICPLSVLCCDMGSE